MSIAGFSGQCRFEFKISNPLEITEPLFTSSFVTSSGHYWELIFEPISQKDPEYCGLYLRAILNAEEQVSTASWKKRENITIRIFIRDVDGSRSGSRILFQSTLFPDFLSLRSLARGIISTTSTSDSLDPLDSPTSPTFLSPTINSHLLPCFSTPSAPVGNPYAFKRSELPSTIIIGAFFTEDTLTTDTVILGRPTVPYHLLKAWIAELDNKEVGDVQFSIKGRQIYARSAILKKRSKYFEQALSSEWAEKQSINDKANPNIKHFFEITDFDAETFLQMLKFLYTDQTPFEDSSTPLETALSMLTIADKYLITELRQRSKEALIQQIDDENAYDVLFSYGWQWSDVKEELMAYVISHFDVVRMTTGFKKISMSPGDYPLYTELFIEIMQSLNLTG
ncbi:9983_t:CDS:2 [Paraglomus brasilianum]|uniref:9983_t:CDS:1 n=1 Tax=Paraglomus brasilianum TaxID=144538 RepID=A0A9N9AF60_9GLOM|nr:9983_t:CDS:2 [Paraglomus brasilianum]